MKELLEEANKEIVKLKKEIERLNEEIKRLNSTTDMTADEMFEELGYKKIIPNNGCWVEYVQKEHADNDYEGRIINIQCYGEYYYKTCGKGMGVGITEAEDKAIHGKIKELKNG